MYLQIKPTLHPERTERLEHGIYRDQMEGNTRSIRNKTSLAESAHEGGHGEKRRVSRSKYNSHLAGIHADLLIPNGLAR
jgi:hypothetical protein